MKKDNLKEVLEQIVRRLEEAFDPERIILFGSYAYGEPSRESDIDLLIVVPESTEPAYRRAQKAYECVGAVGFSKDLVVLTRQEFETQAEVSTSLARRAMEEGEVCYERSKAR
jgi:uncharacterized protein